MTIITPPALDQNTALINPLPPPSSLDAKECPEAVQNAINAHPNHQALQNVQFFTASGWSK